MWAIDDIRIRLDHDATDFPVVGVEIETPSGTIRVIGELIEVGRRIVVRDAHIESAAPDKSSVGHAEIGVGNLIAIARAFLEEVDAGEIVIG
jgi:hypothetical protein